ncbi:MAG: hypothetical protein ACFB2Z_14850 [Maricaulaceae bacterium]
MRDLTLGEMDVVSGGCVNVEVQTLDAEGRVIGTSQQSVGCNSGVSGGGGFGFGGSGPVGNGGFGSPGFNGGGGFTASDAVDDAIGFVPPQASVMPGSAQVVHSMNNLPNAVDAVGNAAHNALDINNNGILVDEAVFGLGLAAALSPVNAVVRGASVAVPVLSYFGESGE